MIVNFSRPGGLAVDELGALVEQLGPGGGEFRERGDNEFVRLLAAHGHAQAVWQVIGRNPAQNETARREDRGTIGGLQAHHVGNGSARKHAND